METELPATKTPVTAVEMYDALYLAWTKLFGEEPKRMSLLVLLAQSALETGRWHSMWCYNVGNVKHVPGDGRDYCYFRCNEIIKGKVVWFDPPHPGCCFRAYPSLEAGVEDYLRLLRKRFSSAWPAVIAGDPARFAQRLKAARYYTADENLYAKGLVSLTREFQRSIPKD